MQIQALGSQRFSTCHPKAKNGLKNPDIAVFYRNNKFIPQALSFKGLEAIIFDADGTMVYSEPYHDPAWAQLCLNHQPNKLPIDFKAGLTKENVKIFKNFPHSGTTKETVKQLFYNLSPEEIKAYAKEKDDLFLKLAKDIQEIKGATKFIKALHDIKKAVATCANSESIAFYLRKLNIVDCFDDKFIIDSSKVTKGKPDPEVYLKAADALKVSPLKCAVFEDSSEGIESVLRAGMKAIGVTTSLSKEKLTKLGAILTIKDYTEINLPKIKALF